MSILFNPLSKVLGWVSGQAGKVLKPNEKKVNDLAPGPQESASYAQPIQGEVSLLSESKVTAALTGFLPENKAQKSAKNDQFLKRFQKRLKVERHLRQREELKESLKELQCACEAREWLYQQCSRQTEQLNQILTERDALLIALDDFPKYMRNLQEEHDIKAELAFLKASIVFVEERKARAEENVAAAKEKLLSRQRAKVA